MSDPWECPRCHVIHAPWVPKCSCKPEKPPEQPLTQGHVEYLNIDEIRERLRDGRLPWSAIEPRKEPE